MMTELERYLSLERKLLAAEKRRKPTEAARLRDIMDRLWYRLSADERNLLIRAPLRGDR